MTERTTRAQLQESLETLTQLLAQNEPDPSQIAYGPPHIATSSGDVGGWALDHNSFYGGWTITRIVSAGGSQDHPLGESRCPATEMWYRLYTAAQVLYLLAIREPAHA